jgi:hypothetical protein
MVMKSKIFVITIVHISYVTPLPAAYVSETRHWQQMADTMAPAFPGNPCVAINPGCSSDPYGN